MLTSRWLEIERDSRRRQRLDETLMGILAVAVVALLALAAAVGALS